MEQEKIYLVILEYSDKWNNEEQRDIRCFRTEEKALEVFTQLVADEEENWVDYFEDNEYEEFDLDYYVQEKHFEVNDDDRSIVIYIREEEVE